MSVYKPAQGKIWQFDYRWQGHRHHGSTGCASRRDAERFEAQHRRKVALGEKTVPSITLREACSTWQAQVGDLCAARATTLYQLGYLMTGLGANVPLHDLTFRAVQDYAAKRRARLSSASVNREIELLRRVVRWTGRRAYEVPTLEWGKLLYREPSERVRELLPDEQDRLFAALPDNLKPLVEFALLSGQRKGEIVTLRWADVDLLGARAKVWAKGGLHHMFPLSPRMVAIIKAQPKVCPQVFTYLCSRRAPDRKDRPGRRVGERYPFSKQGWNRQWRAALKTAGIDDYRFHDNRHTAATRNLRRTGNLKGVQTLLGHKSIETTTRYAHAIESDVRAMLFATESQIFPEAGDAPIAETAEKRA